MKGFTLTSEGLQELRAFHKEAAKKKVAYKINAVILSRWNFIDYGKWFGEISITAPKNHS